MQEACQLVGLVVCSVARRLLCKKRAKRRTRAKRTSGPPPSAAGANRVAPRAPRPHTNGHKIYTLLRVPLLFVVRVPS